jgi:two-component system, NarL family, response regulator DesR
MQGLILNLNVEDRELTFSGRCSARSWRSIISRRGPVQVLIADDDDGFRTFMRRVLNMEAGTSVVGEALDGLEAVRKAENLRPQLILMDMDLPRLDGLEATRRVKESHPETLVVMLGSLDGVAYREAAARSGADGFIVKNTPIAQILSMLRHWGIHTQPLRRKGKSI